MLPESHYAAAKLAGEALIAGFANLYDWQAYAFRFGNTVGPRSNHGVVHDLVVKLLRKKREVVQRAQLVRADREVPHLHPVRVLLKRCFE